jgi:hypothetical protein
VFYPELGPGRDSPITAEVDRDWKLQEISIWSPSSHVISGAVLTADARQRLRACRALNRKNIPVLGRSLLTALTAQVINRFEEFNLQDFYRNESAETDP